VIPWTRIEPDTRDPTMEQGLRAELADPLWLLARQWQMGEFRGEDVGTPVLASIETASDRPQVLFARGRLIPLDGAADSIESLIEREVAVPPDDFLQLHGAVIFAELLSAAGLPSVASTCAAMFALGASGAADADADPDSAAARVALAGRVADAQALFSALQPTPAALTRRLGVPAEKQQAFADVAAAWLAWYGSRRGEGGGFGWSDNDGCHHAAVRTLAGAELRISAHRGGTLDWTAFDSRQPVAEPPAERERIELVPLPLHVPGTGSLRFWEMEDAQVDLGTLAAGSTEIARIVLSEYALLWGHDWFVVPVPLPTGAWVSLPRLVICDTFGVETEIPPALSGAGFGLWRHDGLVCAAAGLWVPAVAPIGESAQIERLDLIVDEGSNMRWARETRLRGPLGFTLEGPNPGLREKPAAADRPSMWLYRPFAPPPPGFVPLVERDGKIVPAALRLGDLPIPQLETPLAHSLALAADLLRTDGMSITRQWEVARAVDGRLVAWIGRRRHDQPPITTAALVFDELRR
jgi:hypothetical protein